jgi:hypothetical protein
LLNPKPSGSSHTRPPHERLRSHQEIAGHDFLMHNLFTIKTLMNKTLKAPDPLPPVLADEQPGLILRVSGLMRSWFSWPRELRQRLNLRHLSLRWTTQILSVNRGSRFRMARVLCIQKPRYAELRLSGILCHVSLLFGGSDLVGVFTWISPSTCPRECRFPDGKYPNFPSGSPDTRRA